jgi:hypothetical protein
MTRNDQARNDIRAQCDAGNGALTGHGAMLAHLVRKTQAGACICADLDNLAADGLQTFGVVCDVCRR